MIDITSSVISILSRIEETGGRVYRRWPQANITMPSVLVSRISNTPILTDDTGADVIANVVYSIDINASDQRTADQIASKAVDALAGYNLQRTGFNDFYDDTYRTYRIILTVSGIVDTRGNTFA